MIRSTISSVLPGAFTIGEHTISIDPAKTGSLRQLGTIETGARAEVRARRVDGRLYAEHIVITGTGQGKTQVVFTKKQETEKPDKEIEKEKHATIDARVRLNQLALYLKTALKLFASIRI